MSHDARVLAILEQTARHLAAIRTAGNGEDVDAQRAAHETFAGLLSLGMTDAWVESDDEEPPTPETWGWDCEPLEAGADWAPGTRARFHRVCGDLNLLHSNDAGLNAAKSNYEAAVGPLREIDPESAVLCYARLLRAAAYASYSAKVVFEHLGGLLWATEAARSMPQRVRDELELSVVEMTPWLLGGAFSMLAEPESGQVEAIAALLQRLLLELCARADALPFRRSLPFLVAAELTGTALLEGDALAPFLGLGGARDVPSFKLYAAERALALEDGIFYPHGGSLSPGRYIEGIKTRASRIRLDALTALGRREAVEVADALLATCQEEFEESTRAPLELLKLRAASRCGDMELWRECARSALAWLEPRAGAWWWSMSGISEGLAEVEALATEQAFADVADLARRVQSLHADAGGL